MKTAPSLSLLCIAAACLLINALAWGQSLQVIELKHRTAQEVIPVLQPLLEPGGALTGQDYTLFVRAGSGNVAQLRQALAQIDRSPRQLSISVRRASEQEIERERAAASGTIRSGDATVSVNERPGRSGATVRATGDTSSRSNSGVSSVRVLEGGSAHIATGHSVPIVTTVAAGAGRRPWAASSTSYRDLNSGFTVTPRVNGELAILDIEQQQEGVSAGRIESQRLTTQLSAKLGEWVRLGGVSESVETRQRGVLTHSQQTRSDDLALWVKVEVL